MNSKIL